MGRIAKIGRRLDRDAQLLADFDEHRGGQAARLLFLLKRLGPLLLDLPPKPSRIGFGLFASTEVINQLAALARGSALGGALAQAGNFSWRVLLASTRLGTRVIKAVLRAWALLVVILNSFDRSFFGHFDRAGQSRAKLVLDYGLKVLATNPHDVAHGRLKTAGGFFIGGDLGLHT